MEWAEGKMHEAGLQAAFGVWRKHQNELEVFVADAITDNPALPDFLRAHRIPAARVVGADTFEEFVLRISPSGSLE
jgi:hypothetical protein